uniref:Reticulon-like protein n=1 Tax=Rhabditophanes sp. KR3021 TaxID=114890 RepID=A0AC35U901_9BILA
MENKEVKNGHSDDDYEIISHEGVDELSKIVEIDHKKKEHEIDHKKKEHEADHKKGEHTADHKKEEHKADPKKEEHKADHKKEETESLREQEERLKDEYISQISDISKYLPFISSGKVEPKISPTTMEKNVEDSIKGHHPQDSSKFEDDDMLVASTEKVVHSILDNIEDSFEQIHHQGSVQKEQKKEEGPSKSEQIKQFGLDLFEAISEKAEQVYENVVEEAKDFAEPASKEPTPEVVDAEAEKLWAMEKDLFTGCVESEQKYDTLEEAVGKKSIWDDEPVKKEANFDTESPSPPHQSPSHHMVRSDSYDDFVAEAARDFEATSQQAQSHFDANSPNFDEIFARAQTKDEFRSEREAVHSMQKGHDAFVADLEEADLYVEPLQQKYNDIINQSPPPLTTFSGNIPQKLGSAMSKDEESPLIEEPSIQSPIESKITALTQAIPTSLDDLINDTMTQQQHFEAIAMDEVRDEKEIGKDISHAVEDMHTNIDDLMGSYEHVKAPESHTETKDPFPSDPFASDIKHHVMADLPHPAHHEFNKSLGDSFKKEHETELVQDLLGDVVEPAKHHQHDDHLSHHFKTEDIKPTHVEEEKEDAFDEATHHKEVLEDEDAEENMFSRDRPILIGTSTEMHHQADAFNIPRPPTPPKELTDEEFQPTSIDLGPPPHHFTEGTHHSTEGTHHKSILKKNYEGKGWFDFKSCNPEVVDLVYWRDLKKSGIALGLSLFALIAVSKISLITLFAYGSLLVLCGTLGFRAFKLVEARVKGTEPTHPFEELLKEELVIPGEKVHGQVDVLVGELQCIVNKLQKIVLIDNICESVKFALFCWILTYVGACISLFCIAFLAIVGVFTIPKVYEMYKEPIDANLKLVKEQLNAVCVTVHEKLPFLGSLCCNKSTAPQVEEEKKDQ